MMLKLPWFRRTPPARQRQAAGDVDHDRRAREIAVQLQERACGWWMVMWVRERGCYEAIFRGWLETGALRIREPHPEDLWNRMEPYVPVQARVPAIRAWSSREILPDQDGRTG
jgi:hypothetical protein